LYRLEHAQIGLKRAARYPTFTGVNAGVTRGKDDADAKGSQLLNLSVETLRVCPRFVREEV
jgi:hypothetical protein